MPVTNLQIDKPFTGRVNLHAERSGVVVVDRARIDRLNLVDEAVTLGTLPAFASVQPGQMVATIKIIPGRRPSARRARGNSRRAGEAGKRRARRRAA